MIAVKIVLLIFSVDIYYAEDGNKQIPHKRFVEGWLYLRIATACAVVIYMYNLMYFLQLIKPVEKFKALFEEIFKDSFTTVFILFFWSINFSIAFYSLG